MGGKGRIVKVKLSQQRGFTLLEGMLAAVVLSVGLLAMAGMQGISLSRNVNANELGRVTNVASDLMERIKFNRRSALAYHLINTGANGCSNIPAAQLEARGDCAQWATLVANSGLVNAMGTVQVTRVDADPNLNPVTLNRFNVVVQVTWTGNNQTQTSGPQTKTVTIQTVLAPE